MRGSKTYIFTVPFAKISEYGREVVGGKGANLGRLYSLRVPVPNGFTITTYAFLYFLEVSKLGDFIRSELAGITASDSSKIDNASKRIRNGFLKFEIDENIVKEINKAYGGLSGFTDAYVAVRSSSISEDQPNDSFAGMHSTFLNVKGKKDLIDKVKSCWASMYSPQNIFYSLSRGIDISKSAMAVVVQKMVQAEVSGVMFTINPVDNDSSKISIEAILGLGEALVSGQITPDIYVIDKLNGNLVEKHIVPQDWMLVRKGRIKKGEDPNVKVNVGSIWKTKQKLDNKYIERLTKVGKALEEYFNVPQDIEWVYEGGKIWIVQTRPVTTLNIEKDSWKSTPTYMSLQTKIEKAVENENPPVEVKDEQYDQLPKEEEKESKKTQIIQGVGANEGLVSGPIVIIKNIKDLENIKPGSIIATVNITPEFEGKVDNVVGIIEDEIDAGLYSKIMAKSLKIPCVVDTKVACVKFKNQEQITLNGTNGIISSGSSEEGLFNAVKILQKRNEKDTTEIKKIVENTESQKKQLKTATKIFIKVTDPDSAQILGLRNIDGIGEIDGGQELINFGIHPYEIINNPKIKEEYITKLSLDLYKVAKPFDSRPVIYKLPNLSSNEYKVLQNGEKYEVPEANPKIGFRGLNRLITNPEYISCDIEAILKVRNKENLKNIWVCLSYARSSKELVKIKRILSSMKLRRSVSTLFFTSLDVPINIINFEKYLKMGIDGVILDYDIILKNFLLIDDENPRLQGDYEKVTKPVFWALENIAHICHKNKLKIIVNFSDKYINEEFIKHAVKHGVWAITVPSDYHEKTREIVYDCEKSLILKRKK